MIVQAFFSEEKIWVFGGQLTFFGKIIYLRITDSFNYVDLGSRSQVSRLKVLSNGFTNRTPSMATP